jgi:hypothetical protein
LALPDLCTLAITGGAVSTRQLTALRICFRSAAESLTRRLQRGVHTVAEDVVVLEDFSPSSARSRVAT